MRFLIFNAKFLLFKLKIQNFRLPAHINYIFCHNMNFLGSLRSPNLIIVLVKNGQKNFARLRRAYSLSIKTFSGSNLIKRWKNFAPRCGRRTTSISNSFVKSEESCNLNITCPQMYKMPLSSPNLLKQIMSGEKYH